MESTRRGLSARWSVIGAVVLGVLALSWYAVATGDTPYVAARAAYPGALTAIAEPVGYFVVALLGAMTCGGLLYVAITARPDDRGLIDAAAFRSHLLAERSSALWAVLAAVMAAVQTASDAGTSVTRLVLDPVALGSAIQASEPARAAVAVALLALVIAVVTRISLRWVSDVVLLLPAFVGVIAIPVSGNAGQGPDHDYAASTTIVFAVALATAVGLKLAAALAPPEQALARRVLIAETVCGAVSIGYGAGVFALLVGGNPLRTSYGIAGLVAGALLLAGLVADVIALRSRRRVPRSITAAGAVAVVAAIASMATQPAPRLLEHEFTTWDVFLGYELTQPPGVLTILTVWRFDTFLGVAALVLAAAYLIGYLRLRRRGDAWPVGRLVAWLTGCAILLFTTSSGVKAYGSAMFSVHMAEHMTLNMLVPVLLVLGGPVTLALRVLPTAGSGAHPGPREWVLRLIHSRVTAFLSNPITAFVLFVGSPYAVYFTPLFDILVRYHWGHELMSVHFLLVGYLFFWGIIGIDPGPRRLPFLGRLGLLFAVMPFHAFFGVATMNMVSPIGEQFYRMVDLPWLSSLAADQRLGGAIAWSSSEIPVIAVVIALVAQWARSDRRAAARSDRHQDSEYADDDLEAYNAMLRELTRQRR